MISCSGATERLIALKNIRNELVDAMYAVKNETDEIKKDKIQETARHLKMILTSELHEITVQDATNPYREAMLAAGFPETHELCGEKKEITFNFWEVIVSQAELYKAQNLEEWAGDIEDYQDELFELISDPEEQIKIKERIAFGMIPLVMPGRKVQQETWKQALTNLKPVYIKDGETKWVGDPDVYEKETFGGEIGYSGFMNKSKTHEHLPDRPYIVWVKPSSEVEKNNVEWKTTELDYSGQVQKLGELHEAHPVLVDAHDISPLEYASLHSLFTNHIQVIARQESRSIAKMLWIDDCISDSYARFISCRLFIYGEVSLGYSDPVSCRLYFAGDSTDARKSDGFRPVART